MLLVVTDIDMHCKQAVPFSTMEQLFKASLLRGQLIKCYKPKYTDIFVEKMREAFAIFSHFFNKNIGVFQISMFKILTKR